MPADSLSDAALARALMRDAPFVALATLDAEGAPFASYAVTALSAAGAPLLLLSRLAVHSQNLARDPRASLLFVREPGENGEAMTAERLTLTGRALKEDGADARRRFLARHADAARYAGFADFSLYRFDLSAGHLVAGFGRIVTLASADLLRAAEPGDAS